MLVTNCCNFSIVEYLRGFEAFKETSFVVTDSHSHSFEWQKYGLKLHIPKGTVSAEHTECRVNIKVGLAGQFSIPDDLQLVSCIYWLTVPIFIDILWTMFRMDCANLHRHFISNGPCQSSSTFY